MLSCRRLGSFVAITVMAVSGCGEGGGGGGRRTDPRTVALTIINTDPSQYKINYVRWDSGPPLVIDTENLQPDIPAGTILDPSVSSYDLLLDPTSATLHHYLELTSLAGAVLDVYEIVKGANPVVIIIQVNAGAFGAN